MNSVKDHIIVALDVASLDEAKRYVEMLSPYVGYFKIGLELMNAVGTPTIVKVLHDLGGKIFFDGKFNDIPNTVGAASKVVSLLQVAMFNVHAASGISAIRAAVENKGKSLVLVVTILTSLDDTESQHIFGKDTKTKIFQFASDALKAGADGLICSPKDLLHLKQYPELSPLLKITPGVRPAWAVTQDQKRTLTPFEAIKAGASALVIGRPIMHPPKEIKNSIEAAKQIGDEIAKAL